MSQGNRVQLSDRPLTVNIINPLPWVINICKPFLLQLLCMRSATMPYPSPKAQAHLTCPYSHKLWFPQFKMMAASVGFHLCLFYHFLHALCLFQYLSCFLRSSQPAYANFSYSPSTCPRLLPSLSVTSKIPDTVMVY